MKKTTALITIVILLFSLTACSDNYEKGTLTNTTFESEYLDLKFTLPEGYVLATEAEMKERSAQGAQLAQFDSNAYDDAMENTVHEMQTASATGNPNIIILVEKTSIGISNVDAYIVNLKQQLANIKEIKYEIEAAIEEITFVGKSYKKVAANAEFDEVKLNQEYYIRKQDNRIVSIIISFTSDTKEQKDQLLSAFSSYK